jgi:hypothetical protein
MLHALDLCMFCLRDDGEFRSEEHVLPESLGNKVTIIPRGVICDRCNNGPLSMCDEALVKCPPIALLKTTQFIRSKKNRLPRAEFGAAGVYALDDGGEDSNIYLRVPDDAAVRDGEGEFEVEVSKSWSPRDWSLLSRALLKAGFEMLAFDHGKAYVMDARFDGLRAAVLKGGYRGWVMYNRTNEPTSEVSLTYPPFDIEGTSRSGLLAAVTVFGVRLATSWPARDDLLRQFPDVPGVENLEITHFGKDAGKRPASNITLRFTVTYGSRGEWEDTEVIARAVDDVEKRFR